MDFVEMCSDVFCAKIMAGERLSDLDAMVHQCVKEAKVLWEHAQAGDPRNDERQGEKAV